MKLPCPRQAAALSSLAALLAAPVWAQAPSSTPYKRALAEAGAQNKPLFVEFHTQWCPSCLHFEKEVLPDPEVRKRINRFVFARFDSDTPEGWEMHNQLNIRNWPTMIFSKPDGEEVYRRLGGFRDAKECAAFLDDMLARAAQTRRPAASRTPEVVFEKLDQASKRGDEAATREYLKEMEALDPKNQKGWLAKGLFSLAELKRGQMKFEEAGRLLEDLLRRFPESPSAESAAERLETDYKRAGLEKARRVYRLMIAQYPRKAYWYEAYASLCAENRYRLAEGFEMARKAIALEPKVPDHYYTLAVLYHKKNDLPQAIEAMKQAALLDPKDAQLKERLARYEAEWAAVSNLEKNSPLGGAARPTGEN